MTAPERYLTTREYCDLRRIKPQTARRERMRGTGPRYIRTGARVLYRLADVEAWLEARTFRCTAEEHVAAEDAARRGAADE